MRRAETVARVGSEQIRLLPGFLRAQVLVSEDRESLVTATWWSDRESFEEFRQSEIGRAAAVLAVEARPEAVLAAAPRRRRGAVSTPLRGDDPNGTRRDPGPVRPRRPRALGLWKEGRPRRRAARGLRGRRRAARRPRLPGARRPDEGLPGRRDPGPRRGLPRQGGLHRGHLRDARAQLLYQIDPLPLRGGARQREGEPRHGPGAARQGEHRREAPDAAGRSSRRSASRSSTTRCPPGTRPAPRSTPRRRRPTRRRSTSATRTSRRRSTVSWARRRSRPATSSGAARARC